jgi:hypothetical protein
MLRFMASRLRLTSAILLLGALGACEPMYGPPPPSGRIATTPTEDTQFRAGDFAWSKAAGKNSLAGQVTYHAGAVRYGCSGSPVVLTPETPWSRKRIGVLYQSTERAALPIDDVRSRSDAAPPGNSEPYVRKATCDGASHFSFAGLPDGVWYVVVPAKPVGGNGPTLALMRRVTTRGGHATAFEL